MNKLFHLSQPHINKDSVKNPEKVWVLSMLKFCHSIYAPHCFIRGYWTGSWYQFSQRIWWFLLAGHVTSAPGLETDDDVCDLHVSLLLQVSEHSSSEEHFALTDAVQVGVQLQSFDLTRRREKWLNDKVLILFPPLMKRLLLKLIYCYYHEHTGLLAIHKALWNSVWSENFIPERQMSRVKWLRKWFFY